MVRLCLQHLSSNWFSYLYIYVLLLFFSFSKKKKTNNIYNYKIERKISKKTKGRILPQREEMAHRIEKKVKKKSKINSK